MTSEHTAVTISKPSTLIITAEEVQVSCDVWANFSQSRHRHLQAVKLDRYNSCVHDAMHFEGIHWLFVKLSAKNGHTGNGELTVVQRTTCSSGVISHISSMHYLVFLNRPSFEDLETWTSDKSPHGFDYNLFTLRRPLFPLIFYEEWARSFASEQPASQAGCAGPSRLYCLDHQRTAKADVVRVDSARCQSVEMDDLVHVSGC